MSVTQDPGGFGVLTRVKLRVGPQKVLVWLGAYVPSIPKTFEEGRGSLQNTSVNGIAVTAALIFMT